MKLTAAKQPVSTYSRKRAYLDCNLQMIYVYILFAIAKRIHNAQDYTFHKLDSTIVTERNSHPS
jgi:hypothetical protein